MFHVYHQADQVAVTAILHIYRSRAEPLHLGVNLRPNAEKRTLKSLIS